LIDIPIFFNLLEHSASKLHGELLKEEYNNLKNGRQWPEINPGDAVEVERYPYVTAKKYEKVKGVVMGIYNRHSDTSIKLLNVRYFSFYCYTDINPFVSLITGSSRTTSGPTSYFIQSLGEKCESAQERLDPQGGEESSSS
jgi:hypothetical protein